MERSRIANSGTLLRTIRVLLLQKRPYNANQLAELLKLDYKTVRHHLDYLMKHEVIVQQGEGYGSVFFLSIEIDENFESFKEIWEQIGQKGIGGNNDTN